jgi:hypothetical protein
VSPHVSRWHRPRPGAMIAGHCTPQIMALTCANRGPDGWVRLTARPIRQWGERRDHSARSSATGRVRHVTTCRWRSRATNGCIGGRDPASGDRSPSRLRGRSAPAGRSEDRRAPRPGGDVRLQRPSLLAHWVRHSIRSSLTAAPRSDQLACPLGRSSRHAYRQPRTEAAAVELAA